MKKIAFLAALTAIGALLIAATCTIRGATVTVIDGNVWYSAEMEYDDGPNILNHKFAVGFIEGNTNPSTKTVDGCLRSLQSGASNFYSADSGLDEGDADTAVSRLVGPLTFGDVAEGDIVFDDVEATFNADDELVRVTGRLTNEGNDTLNNVRVCVVLRNDDDAITIVRVDNNDYDGFDEDDTQDFSVDVPATDDEDDAVEVDVWVDAHNDDDNDLPTEPQSELDVEVEVCDDPTATATPGTPTATATPGTPTATNTPQLPDAC
jgi:hypothetical protein